MNKKQFENIEHLTKALAHLNCAMEHLDLVPLQQMFTFSDKQKMKAFIRVAEDKASVYIAQSYENDEKQFQLLQQALSSLIHKPVIDLINGEIQRLPTGDNREGHFNTKTKGDALPSNGGKDRKNPDSVRNSSKKK